MEQISSLVNQLSRAPFDPYLNFLIAKEYLELNQTASAVSFFLRCAEYGESDPKYKIYVYNSLLAIAKCFDDQKNRELSVTNTLFQALAFDDKRPEAYFFLSNYYERAQQWRESYTFAVIGKGWENTTETLPLDLGYLGSYCLDFQRAVSAWWVGRKEEALETLDTLSKMELHPVYRESVKQNLEKLNALL